VRTTCAFPIWDTSAKDPTKTAAIQSWELRILFSPTTQRKSNLICVKKGALSMSATRRLFITAVATVIVLFPVFTLAGTINCEADASVVGHSPSDGYLFASGQYSYSCGSVASGSQYYTDHNYLTDENGPEDYAFYLGANAVAYANATPGINRASATAYSSNSPMVYFYTDSDGTSHALNNNDWVWTQASASSAWSDKITITSSGLPKGTLVDLRTTFLLEATGGGHPTIPGYADISWNEHVAIDANVWLSTLPPGWTRYWTGYGPIEYDYSANSTTCAASGMCAPTEFKFDQWVAVGSSYTIGASLSGGAVAVTGVYDGSPFVSDALEVWNASSTGIYELDILTPGASYVSASGHVYSATPEPASLLLLGSGMAALAGTIRRKLR
jgi:hypothetical protein